MNDLVLAAKAADWYKLKALVLDPDGCTTWRWTNSWRGSGWSRGPLQQGDGQRLASFYRGQGASVRGNRKIALEYFLILCPA